MQPVHQLLATSDYLFLKPFSKANEEWSYGPYRFDRDEMHTLFEPEFQIVSIADTVYQGTLEVKPKALFDVLQKR